MRDKAEELSLRFNVALGYDMNALEFAVKDGKYYGIDLTNYTPDLDHRSLKDAHFPWAVEKMAEFAVEKAKSGEAHAAAAELPRPHAGVSTTEAGRGREPTARPGPGRPRRPAQRAPASSTRDGTFNVRRVGLSPLRSLSLYHHLLTITWPRFFANVAAFYLVSNLAFAFAYVWAGPGALSGTSATTAGGRFLESFFFSVHTLATIGYGTMSPRSLSAHVLVTVEALFGLMGLALVTGILFARFSRPDARIVFSPAGGDRAVQGRLGAHVPHRQRAH